jgi:hypothetical protein
MHRRLPITTETAEVVMAWERHRSQLPTPPAIRHWLFPSPQLRAKQAHGHVTAVCVAGALERLDAADRPDRRRAPRSRRAAPFDRSRVTPSALRHSYVIALVNAGVSLQALMALLGHVSAAMSLRYARLFDATVRTEYERALDLAKSHLGPLPAGRPGLPLVDVTGGADWKAAPALKTRLAGGFCLRAPVQGACPYANICEHCPSFRTDSTHLPVLAAQRLDAQALAADAEARGWIEEADRHRRLIDRLDAVLAQAANT